MDLNKRIESLERINLNCNVFSVYDYPQESMQELLCRFFTKINECIEVSNGTLELAKWLVDVGLSQEVAKKLEEWLIDGTLSNIINVTIFNELNDKITVLENENNMVSVINYGATGDGVTDDTQAIVRCFNYCSERGLVMFFPNGTYILNEKLKKSNSITDPNASKKIFIRGESFRGVIINTTMDIKPVIDVSRSLYVYMENLASENSWFHCLQYGDDFRAFSRKRDVYLCNVVSLDREHTYPSWNLMINTPAPKNYNSGQVDSYYNRYPLEIINNSGFNGIMINNFASRNDDGTPGYPPDQSGIGILDEVSNSTGTILIDCGTRSNYQVKNGSADSKSEVRQDVVYEIDQLGRISQGCSTQNSDPVAPGIYAHKIRQAYPSTCYYDKARSNRKTEVGSGDDVSYMKSYDEGGTLKGGFEVNYKTGVMKPINCDLVLGDELDINDSNFSSFLESGWRNIINFSLTSARTLEGLNGGSVGQFITIRSDNSNLTIKHDNGWAKGIKLKSATNLVLQPHTCLMLQKLRDGWYEI